MTAAGEPTPRTPSEPGPVLGALRALTAVGLVLLGLGAAPGHRALYWLLVGAYGLSVPLVRPRRRARSRTLLGLVLGLDVVTVGVLVVIRGAPVPGFLAAYLSLVLLAAILEGVGTALVNAILVSVAFATITRWGAGPSDLLSLGTLAHLAFFFVVALFMSHLAHAARAQAQGKAKVEEALRHTSDELQHSTEELKATREVLRANDRLATLGMLSAGITHEMKNPLAAIANSIEPAREILEDMQRAVAEGKDGAGEARELQEVFDDCSLACRQLMRVVKDLTTMARGGRAVPLPVDPLEAIEGAARILKTRVRPPLVFRSEAKTRRLILADPGRVLQVLLNLASNALDAMDGQKEGVLQVRAEDADAFHIAFVVEDTGPGIPEEIRQRVFEPFFTTKDPGHGTGLGLHLVSEITKSLRGTIRYETAAGGGACFRVELPVFIRRDRSEFRHEPRPEPRRPEDGADRGRRGDHSPGVAANVPTGAV